MCRSLGKSWLSAIVAVVWVAGTLFAASGPKGQTGALAPRDEQAIRATMEAYRTAWMANDPKGVLSTFTEDAVLLPAHGAAAVAGIAAIEKYWFASGVPPTVLTELKVTVDQVSGNDTLAFARGLDSVAWTVTDKRKSVQYSHPGTYLNVMKKLPDGSWRIQAHMWDDGPQKVEELR